MQGNYFYALPHLSLPREKTLPPLIITHVNFNFLNGATWKSTSGLFLFVCVGACIRPIQQIFGHVKMISVVFHEGLDGGSGIYISLNNLVHHSSH